MDTAAVLEARDHDHPGRRKRAAIIGAVVAAVLVAGAVGEAVSAREAGREAAEVRTALEGGLTAMDAEDRRQLIADATLWGFDASSPHPLTAVAAGHRPVETVNDGGALRAAFRLRRGLATRCVWVRVSETDVVTRGGRCTA